MAAYGVELGDVSAVVASVVDGDGLGADVGRKRILGVGKGRELERHGWVLLFFGWRDRKKRGQD